MTKLFTQPNTKPKKKKRRKKKIKLTNLTEKQTTKSRR